MYKVLIEIATLLAVAIQILHYLTVWTIGPHATL